MEEIHLPFAAWESFYVIVGSSGAALTGLQFVVMALVAESNTGSTDRTIAAFGTPTVVHFSAVLLVSAVLSAPWHGLAGACTVLTVAGIAGILYALLITVRARRQHEYKPVMEDWIWHMILPFIAYAALLGGALNLRSHTDPALFVIGGTVLLLLFIGIHNSWDTVIYVALSRARRQKPPE